MGGKGGVAVCMGVLVWVGGERGGQQGGGGGRGGQGVQQGIFPCFSVCKGDGQQAVVGGGREVQQGAFTLCQVEGRCSRGHSHSVRGGCMNVCAWDRIVCASICARVCEYVRVSVAEHVWMQWGQGVRGKQGVCVWNLRAGAA